MSYLEKCLNEWTTENIIEWINNADFGSESFTNSLIEAMTQCEVIGETLYNAQELDDVIDASLMPSYQKNAFMQKLQIFKTKHEYNNNNEKKIEIDNNDSKKDEMEVDNDEDVQSVKQYEDVSQYGNEESMIKQEQVICSNYKCKHVGLNNMGNTCFMNAAIQCALSIPSISEQFYQEYEEELKLLKQKWNLKEEQRYKNELINYSKYEREYEQCKKKQKEQQSKHKREELLREIENKNKDFKKKGNNVINKKNNNYSSQEQPSTWSISSLTNKVYNLVMPKIPPTPLKPQPMPSHYIPKITCLLDAWKQFIYNIQHDNYYNYNNKYSNYGYYDKQLSMTPENIYKYLTSKIPGYHQGQQECSWIAFNKLYQTLESDIAQQQGCNNNNGPIRMDKDFDNVDDIPSKEVDIQTACDMFNYAISQNANSIITKQIGGIQLQKKTCQDCDFEHRTYSYFDFILLPLINYRCNLRILCPQFKNSIINITVLSNVNIYVLKRLIIEKVVKENGIKKFEHESRLTGLNCNGNVEFNYNHFGIIFNDESITVAKMLEVLSSKFILTMLVVMSTKETVGNGCISSLCCFCNNDNDNSIKIQCVKLPGRDNEIIETKTLYQILCQYYMKAFGNHKLNVDEKLIVIYGNDYISSGQLFNNNTIKLNKNKHFYVMIRNEKQYFDLKLGDNEHEYQKNVDIISDALHYNNNAKTSSKTTVLNSLQTYLNYLENNNLWSISNILTSFHTAFINSYYKIDKSNDDKIKQIKLLISKFQQSELQQKQDFDYLKNGLNNIAKQNGFQNSNGLCKSSSLIANVQEGLDLMFKNIQFHDKESSFLQCKCDGGSNFKREEEEILLLPKYLIINLDRGQNTANNNLKLSHIVHYPIDNLLLNNNKYDLIAVNVHSGHSTNSGHYYAYIRNLNKPKTWNRCNDSSISQSDYAPCDSEGSNAKFLIYCRNN